MLYYDSYRESGRGCCAVAPRRFGRAGVRTRRRCHSPGGLRRLARTAIIHLSFKELARAVTIAVRYSAVRRQVLPYGKGLRGAEVGESTHDRGCGLRLAGVQGFDG